MKRVLRVSSVGSLGLLLWLSTGTARAVERTVTIKGYVLDSTCAFVKGIHKPVSKECAEACAKAGSTLVILSDAGTIYWPISATMPAAGQNERLLPFAAQRVVVTGKTYLRGGSHAMAIEKIEAAK